MALRIATVYFYGVGLSATFRLMLNVYHGNVSAMLRLDERAAEHGRHDVVTSRQDGLVGVHLMTLTNIKTMRIV